ncbi:MAG TPA: enoyl-CoA hydratase/isomerase family protein [Terriglobia bacterium]|nr:enoyl-CoA hydratase/isomerase family protein [Terriglobia bacterium]
MTYSTLKLEVKDAIATLTLARPEKRNAISPEMVEELQSALSEIESGEARVAIVAGAGEDFCAGMDLFGLKSIAATAKEKSGGSSTVDADANTGNARRVAAMFRRFYEFSKPLIAAVTGHAVAGGCGIAMLCDFTLAVPEAKFGFTEIRVGFMPALIAAFVLRELGEKRARDLLLTGRIFGAEEACKLGLVNEIVAPERLRDRALEIAAQYLALSPNSLQYTKRLIADYSRVQLDRDIETGIEWSARIRSTADFQEGLSAFLEKRTPRWTGR